MTQWTDKELKLYIYFAVYLCGYAFSFSVHLSEVYGRYSLCLLWSTVKPGAITTAEDNSSELRSSLAKATNQQSWIMETVW